MSTSRRTRARIGRAAAVPVIETPIPEASPVRPAEDADASGGRRVSAREWRKVRSWLVIALVLRVALMLFVEVTGVEETLNLTKDAFLYDRTGQEMAQYWRTGGATDWPRRVDGGVIDRLFEYEVGALYLLTGNMMVSVRVLNVLAGTMVPFLVWQTARLLFDEKVSRRALIWSALFPTQLYYSVIMIRDSQSTMAMSMVFLGLVAVVARGSRRQVACLPLGLLLVAALRTYMFVILAALIPLAWLAATLLVRSRGKSRFISRAATAGVMCAVVASGAGLHKAFMSEETALVTDVGFVNRVRDQLNTGSGRMYKDGEVPQLFESVGGTVEAVGTGLYHFVFSVNPAEVESFKQLMAIPEVLLICVALPSVWRGMKRCKKHYPLEMAAPILIALAITFAYSSVATNGGPMMRWRLQTVNVYILVAALGWDRRVRLPDWKRAGLGKSA